MFGLTERKRRRLLSIPDNHAVKVFTVTPYPLKNLIYFDMVDVEHLTLKQIGRLCTWKSFLIKMRYSSPKYSHATFSSSAKAFRGLRDQYLEG